jgi:hypothetical protein
MTTMLSLRTFRLTDKCPASVSVVANTPVHVPPMLHKAALAAGMVFCNDADEQVKKVFAEPESPDELTREQRDLLVKKAFEDISATNVSTDFTGTGIPTSGAVFRACGQKVPQKDIAALWTEFKIPKDE